MAEDRPEEALKGFQKVIEMEGSMGEWCVSWSGARCVANARSDRPLSHRRGFKAYKKIVKLQFALGQHDAMLASYRYQGGPEGLRVETVGVKERCEGVRGERRGGRGMCGRRAEREAQLAGRAPQPPPPRSKMLEYAKGAVTKNASEKKVNSLLDWMAACPDSALLRRFYELTLASQDATVNERLWFKTNLKLCEMWLAAEDFAPMARVVRQLRQVRAAASLARTPPCASRSPRTRTPRFIPLTHTPPLRAAHAHAAALHCHSRTNAPSLSILTRTHVPPHSHPGTRTAPHPRTRRHTHRSRAVQMCETPDGAPDLKKATSLLEVYAVEIQMCTLQKNHRQLKELYTRALTIKSAIPHPRIMGVVRECGGKMHMRERAWEDAATDFFEAFKSYDEAGSARRCGVGRSFEVLRRAGKGPRAGAAAGQGRGVLRARSGQGANGCPCAQRGVPQVPGAGQHADGERGGPIRRAGGQAVSQ